MFVQIIRARVNDAEGALAHMRSWEHELADGATGWLGSTGGVSDNGWLFVMARFESEQAARANSERPEQGAWFEKARGFLDGDPTFVDSTDVETMHGGGTDDAGFVQVMEVQTSDAARYRELSKRSEAVMREARPDVLGGVRAWHPDGTTCTEVIYFASEAEAREGEGREPEGEVKALFEEWQSVQAETSFLDLRSLHLASPQ